MGICYKSLFRKQSITGVTIRFVVCPSYYNGGGNTHFLIILFLFYVPYFFRTLFDGISAGVR